MYLRPSSPGHLLTTLGVLRKGSFSITENREISLDILFTLCSQVFKRITFDNFYLGLKKRDNNNNYLGHKRGITLITS